jgi:hypothetical protein
VSPPSEAQAKPWLERRPSSGRAAIGAAAAEARPGADHAASTLPSWLLRTLQDHQRQMASLFNSAPPSGAPAPSPLCARTRSDRRLLRPSPPTRLIAAGWEMEGRSTVPLSQFAQGVRDRCGFSLSDDELRQMLAAVHPERGEPPVGRSVREQPLDYKLLTRAVKMNAGRKASTYIRRSSSAGLVS